MKTRTIAAIIASLIPLVLASSSIAQGMDNGYWGIPSPAERNSAEKKTAKKAGKRTAPPSELRVRRGGPRVQSPDVARRAAQRVRDAVAQNRSDVPGHYVIFFREGIFPYEVLLSDGRTPEAVMHDGKTVTEAAEMLVAAAGGELVDVYRMGTVGFSAFLSKEAAHDLAALPEIEDVSLNRISQSHAVPPHGPWGIDRINTHPFGLDNAAYRTLRGDGVHAYVVDTGIANHSEFLNDVGANRLQPGWAPVSYSYNDDLTGHGTHVASLLGGRTVGVAPGVKLYPVRASIAVNQDGEGTFDSANVRAACDWILAHVRSHGQPAVVNMSFGGDAGNFAEPVTTTNDRAVRDLINAGITVVVSAGNRGDLNIWRISPAHVEEAITVGASTVGTPYGPEQDMATGFTSWGSLMDIWAPGLNIQGASASNPAGYTEMSGTSQAAPHVAGAVALFLQKHPTAKPEDVRNAIVANSSKYAIDPLTIWGDPNTCRHMLYLGGEWLELNTPIVKGTGAVQSLNYPHPNGNVLDIVRMTGASVTVDTDPGQTVRLQWVDENGDLVYGELAGPGNLTVELNAYQGSVPPAKYNISASHAIGRAKMLIEGATADTYFAVYTSGWTTEPIQTRGILKSGETYDGKADVQNLVIEDSKRIARVAAGNAIFRGDYGDVGIRARQTSILQRLVFIDVSASGSGAPWLLCGQNSTFTMDGGRVIVAGGRLQQDPSNAYRTLVATGSDPYGPPVPPFAGFWTNFNFDSNGNKIGAKPLDAAKLAEDIAALTEPPGGHISLVFDCGNPSYADAQHPIPNPSHGMTAP